MISIEKVQIPQDSEFDLQRSMELANLIEVAYNDYEVWDYNQVEQLPKELPPDKFIGSTDFVDL